jgi:C-terminal processing protease CtpA/Prc
VLARAIQIEKRGLVIGDRTAGAVRESVRYTHHVGARYEVFFGVSVTDADLIMSDGKSLENTGVMPDLRVLPSPSDLADGLDPALARALEEVGRPITPADAGRLFPEEWTSN